MKVFTWEEIACNRVPKYESFGVMSDYIRGMFERCDGIHGAILCGSFLGGSHSLASDIDCFCIYDARDVDIVMELLNTISQMAESFSVPIEFITVQDAFARTPFNPIGPLFRAHIQWAADNGGVIKKNPLEVLGKSSRTVIEELVQYLSLRITWLEKKMAEYPTLSLEKQARVLSKVLDPYHVARKVLQAMGFEMAHGPKSAIVTQYALSIDSKYLKNMFNTLHKAAVDYTGMVNYYVSEPSFVQYRHVLKGIEELLPLALSYLHESARFILSHPRFGLCSPNAHRMLRGPAIGGGNNPVFSD